MSFLPFILVIHQSSCTFHSFLEVFILISLSFSLLYLFFNLSVQAVHCSVAGYQICLFLVLNPLHLLHCSTKINNCAAASQSSGRRRQVLSKIRAKRDMTMTIKTEDSDSTLMDESEGHRGRVDDGSSHSATYNTIAPADEKSLLTEYACITLMR